MGYGASLHDPRSRRRLWEGRARALGWYGNHGSTDRCRSSKPRRPRKSWQFSPPPVTVCDMQTIVTILVAFFREIALSHATLRLENHRSPPTGGGPEAGKTTAAASSDRPRVLGLPLPPVATLEGRPRHRQARDGRRLAPPGVPPVLEMEIVPRKAGSPANLERNTRTHPTNEPREPVVGRSPNPRRVIEAGHRCQPSDRNAIHGTASEAAVADLADVPRQPRGLSRFDRFLCGPDGHVRRFVRLHRAAS